MEEQIGTNLQPGFLQSGHALQLKPTLEKNAYPFPSLYIAVAHLAPINHYHPVQKPTLLSGVAHKKHLAAMSVSLCRLLASFSVHVLTF